MNDNKKTKVQPHDAVSTIRQRVSELEAQERAVRESEERYRNIIESIEDGYFEVDLRGNLTFCNKALSRIYGWSQEEFLRKNYHEYTTPEIAEYIYQAFNKVYKTGIPMKVLNYEIIRKDATVVQLEVSVSLMRDDAGKPIGFRGITRDVTERKRMMEENERYRMFVENVTDACFEYDLHGKCMFCNEIGSRMLGYTREEYMQLSHRDRYISQEAADRASEAFREVLQTGLPKKIYDADVLCKDGKTRMFELSVSLIQDGFGKPRGYRGIARDLTDRNRMEEEQNKLSRQLQQAQKMEAIGTLAGGIAHDFNNLLMGIQGNSSLMLLGMDPSHPHYAKLKSIENQVQSGADLARQLLGYAQAGRYEVKATDLNELIARIAVMFGRTKKEIQIHEKYEPKIWTVEVDRNQIEQALLNLFVNAWQAMPGGGGLYLETVNVFLDESYLKPYVVKPGPYVKISVTDTGVGMDEHTRQRVFDPFFTTKGMGRGTGLGLASTYGIFKGHGGIINVYSEKGHGTTFSIYLPASEKQAIGQEHNVPELMPGKETILLVDDEKTIRDVTGEILETLGYKVIIAGSGEEAVEIYQSKRDRIDLVIMDMIMPGIGGGKAFDRLKAVNPDVKVILSSGYSLNEKATEIMERGVRSFLQKPFRFGDLSQKIREVLSG